MSAVLALLQALVGGLAPCIMTLVEVFAKESNRPARDAAGRLWSIGSAASKAFVGTSARGTRGVTLYRILIAIDVDDVRSQCKLVMPACVEYFAARQIKLVRCVTLTGALYEVLERRVLPAMLRLAKSRTNPALHAIAETGGSLALRTVTTAVAWSLWRVVEVLHAGLRGGLDCGRWAVLEAHRQGLLLTHPDETVLDEVVGVVFACAAIAFQMQALHSLAWIIWPVLFVEGLLAGVTGLASGGGFGAPASTG